MIKYCKNCDVELPLSHSHYCVDCLRAIAITAIITSSITMILNALAYYLIRWWEQAGH